MKLYTFETTQRLPLAVDEAWTFFSDPRNLIKITPPEMNLSPTSPLPDAMYPGMIITYRVRLAPLVKATWVTEITHVEKPHFFVDEQRFGPYRFWHHQHHFRAVEGGVEMKDIVSYALPLDPFSRILHGPLVGGELRKIFAYRTTTLEKVFGKMPTDTTATVSV